MSDKQAKVSSIEAIEHFHNQLTSFSESTLAILDSVKCEVLRLQQKVEFDFPAKLKQEILKWETTKQDAIREINSSRTSSAKLAAEQQLRKAKQNIARLQNKIDYLNKAKQNLNIQLPEPMSAIIKTKVFTNNQLSKASETLKNYAHILHDYTSEGKEL